MSIQQICPVSGECVLFGRGEEVFQSWFQNIRKAGITSIRPIGGVSENGFVRELKRSVGGYDSYVVLKSNLNKTSDNLYYEWRVGQYLNKFMFQFPLFVKTYGVYEYATGDKQLIQDHPEEALPVIARLQDTYMERSILVPENICIVVQQVYEAIPFRELIDDYKRSPSEELRHEILCVLYQVYFVLPLIPSFSHNDLHDNNVILTFAKDKYYEYTYTKNRLTFSFRNRYAAKIIDYGRCVYPFTQDLKVNLDKKNNVEEQKNAGYPWKYVETPCKESDLKLILFCIECGALPRTFFDDIQSPSSWVEDSLCENSFVFMYPPLYANYLKTGNYPDIRAIAKKLETLIQPHTYALPRACTIHVSDVALMQVDWTQRAGTRRKSKRSLYGTKRFIYHTKRRS